MTSNIFISKLIKPVLVSMAAAYAIYIECCLSRFSKRWTDIQR